MVTQIRRTIQTGVDLIRGATAIVKRRSVPDLAVLNQAEAMHEAALALQDNCINPDPERFATVVLELRHHIAGLEAGRMRGDVSGLDGITHPVSRAICEQQLHLIDCLHLVQAVVLGVEQGLRDLIEARPLIDQRIRDGPKSGGHSDRPLAENRRATAQKVDPVQAVKQGSVKGVHGRTGDGAEQDRWALAEPKVTERNGQAADGATGESKLKRAVFSKSDTGPRNIAQDGADPGTRSIVADTPDL